MSRNCPELGQYSIENSAVAIRLTSMFALSKGRAAQTRVCYAAINHNIYVCPPHQCQQLHQQKHGVHASRYLATKDTRLELNR